MQVLGTLTSLDIATARGAHARWMSATRPCLSDPSSADRGCACIHAARHPLLLQRALPSLPAIPGLDEPEATTPKRAGRTAQAALQEAGSEAGQSGAWQPQPVDLLIPPAVRVAAVTGPNTGAPLVRHCLQLNVGCME